MAKKLGFTLSEVLITLGIIGVVAALTLPSLIKKYQDTLLLKQWKDTYAILNQAMIMLLKENNGPIDTQIANSIALMDLFKPYVKHIKECSPTSVGTCWDSNVRTPNGGSTAGWTNNPAIVLVNGAFVRFYMQNPAQGCNQTYYYSTGECGQIQVDVNGFKPPNITGKDVFAIHILKDRLRPAGVLESKDSATKANCSTYGIGCGAELLTK